MTALLNQYLKLPKGIKNDFICVDNTDNTLKLSLNALTINHNGHIEVNVIRADKAIKIVIEAFDKRDFKNINAVNTLTVNHDFKTLKGALTHIQVLLN